VDGNGVTVGWGTEVGVNPGGRVILVGTPARAADVGCGAAVGGWGAAGSPAPGRAVAARGGSVPGRSGAAQMLRSAMTAEYPARAGRAADVRECAPCVLR
jgi:hypothetical protein